MAQKKSVIFCGIFTALVSSLLPIAIPQVQATPSASPSIAITENGSVITTATDNNVFTTTMNAPISVNGQTTQTITTTWDKAKFTFSRNVTVPEGWSVQYTVDGSTWLNSEPANISTVQGLRTTGNVQSVGYANGLQSSITTATSTLKQATIGSISVTSGGDGYDVFFDEEYTKIFNVWHHSSPNQVDCHSLVDGSRCTGFPVTMPLSLGTNDRSTGIVVGNKIWIAAGYGSNPGGGFVCVNTSGSLCTTSFVSLTTNVYTASHSNVGNMARVGKYVFTQNFKDGKVLCLDTDTQAACASMPTGGFDLGNRDLRSYPSTIMDVGNRIYANDGYNNIGCLDTTTWARCVGWETPWVSTRVQQIFPLPNASGDIVAICAFDTSTVGCVDETKTAYTVPASLSTARSTIPNYSMDNDSLRGYESRPAVAGTRVYWINMVWDITQSGSKNTCWDAALNSGAGGLCTFTATNLNYFVDQAYALVVDPKNANCLWTNDNNGQIQSFDALTGSATCPVSPDATAEIPYNVAVPRFSCTEPGRIRQWDSITLSVTGYTLSSLKVSIKKNGLAVSGWQNVSADANGRVNLSSLTVTQSGTRPTFEITGSGLTNTQASSITGDVKYLSDPPQMCLNLTPLSYCPTGVGATSSSTVSRGSDAVTGVVSNVANGANTTNQTTQSVARSSMPNCTGSLGGNVSRNAGGNSYPIANGTIEVRDTNNNVVATTTTDSSGNYSFPVMFPHAYTVSYRSEIQNSAVTATNATTRNFVINPAPPTASPISVSTAQNIAATTSIIATADSLTSIDNSTLQIRSTSGTWGSSVVVANEGTWSVDSAGRVTFTPLTSFSGTATPIEYKVADGFTVFAQSTASATVTASAITARPDAKAGVDGQTLSLTAVADAGTVPIVTGSLQVRKDASSPFERTLTLAGVGTFSASSTANTVSFTPITGWTGIRSVEYKVVDAGGRVTTSTFTATISPQATPRVVVRNGKNGATITWSPSPTATVKTYEVTLNGRVLCTVSASNRACTFPTPIGRASDVKVKSIGNDQTVSPLTPAVKLNECARIATIRFDPDSARISKIAEDRLRKIGDLIKKQKFSSLCIIGNTDARRSDRENFSLSYFRATNVYSHLKAYLPAGIGATLDYAGEKRPASSTGSRRGRELNRRVDIGVRP